MDFWKTKQFRHLYLIWNQKLSDSGFEDAEEDRKNDRSLKQSSLNSYGKVSALERETRLEYYLKIGGEVLRSNFENEIEALIMQMHSDGASIKEIVDCLKNKGLSRHRKTIRLTIRRYHLKWGMKPRTLMQMSRKKVLIK